MRHTFLVNTMSPLGVRRMRRNLDVGPPLFQHAPCKEKQYNHWPLRPMRKHVAVAPHQHRDS